GREKAGFRASACSVAGRTCCGRAFRNPRGARIRGGAAIASLRHIPYAKRFKCAQEFACFFEVRMAQAKEETVARSEVELAYIEHWVVEPGQAVEREHADDAGKRGEEHGELESDGDELRPAMRRLAAGIERIREHRRVPLDEVAANAAGESAAEHDGRDPVAAKARRLRQAFDREGRVRVDLDISGVARLAGRREQPLGARELGHHAVEVHCFFSSRTSSRISKIEIAGSARTKSRKRNAKKAIEPSSVIQSQAVGMKLPQAEGRKSWCMLCTTIVTRSSHMPRF